MSSLLSSMPLWCADIDISVQDKDGNTLLHLMFRDDLPGLLHHVMKNKKTDIYKHNNDGKFAWEMISTKPNPYGHDCLQEDTEVIKTVL